MAQVKHYLLLRIRDEYMKITINTSSFGKYDSAPLDRLEAGHVAYTLNPYQRVLNEEEVIKLSKRADGIIAGTEPLNASVLKELSDLKVISRCGVGLDNVDLNAARDLGIEVFSTPSGPTTAVAELTVGVILDLLRKISLMNQELKSGAWKKRSGNLLYGKKVGIIGFGRIGQKVAELLLPFGVEIGYHDINKIVTTLPTNPQDLTSLLAWADIISIHLSMNKQSDSFRGEGENRQKRVGSWLVNMARRGIVDEQELYKALVSKKLAGAALDVFEQEPYDGPLKDLSQVVLTPHIGSYALEARVNMEIEAVENLIKGLKI